MEKMELPHGWIKTYFGNIYLSASNGYSGAQNKDGRGIPVSRIETIAEENIDYQRIGYIENADLERAEKHKLKLHDILFSHINSPVHIGKTALFDGKQELYHGINLLRIIVDRNKVSPLFFEYYCRYLRYSGFFALNAQHAVNQSSINQKKLSSFEINLAPLAEQKEIVCIIESHLQLVDQIKSRLDALPKILEQFRQSVLASAVSGKLTEDWRELHDIPNDLLKDIQVLKKGWVEQNKDHNEAVRVMRRVKKFSGSIVSQELPRNWSLSNLEDCVLMIVDCHNKTAPYEPEGVPLIRTSNIRNGKFVWEDLKYVSQTTFEFWSRRCIPESGDLIFTREAPMGEVAIIPKNKQVCLGQRTMLIRPIEEKLKAYYLLYVLMNPEFTKKNEAISVGSGVKHYRVRDVSEFEIPIPPLEEQKEIVKRVESLFTFADQIESKIKNAQERVNLLTQSILAKAFRGEFTAKWREDNPDLISGENSAEALLKRIEEAKKNAKKKK